MPELSWWQAKRMWDKLDLEDQGLYRGTHHWEAMSLTDSYSWGA
jgi:hypothetical protein